MQSLLDTCLGEARRKLPRQVPRNT
jgi:hypothetical protein